MGQQDISDQFHIPQKLYGREAEIETLLAAFERISSSLNSSLPDSGRCELMLVAGYAGIGKSALVHEVHKPIVAKRGYFIEGKFDQFRRNIPYASLIQAFQKLVRHLLTETSEEVARWKTKLLEALGTNGQIMIEVIPEVEWVIGKQPPAPALPPAEANNR